MRTRSLGRAGLPVAPSKRAPRGSAPSCARVSERGLPWCAVRRGKSGRLGRVQRAVPDCRDSRPAPSTLALAACKQARDVAFEHVYSTA